MIEDSPCCTGSLTRRKECHGLHRGAVLQVQHHLPLPHIPELDSMVVAARDPRRVAHGAVGCGPYVICVPIEPRHLLPLGHVPPTHLLVGRKQQGLSSNGRCRRREGRDRRRGDEGREGGREGEGEGKGEGATEALGGMRGRRIGGENGKGSLTVTSSPPESTCVLSGLNATTWQGFWWPLSCLSTDRLLQSNTCTTPVSPPATISFPSSRSLPQYALSWNLVKVRRASWVFASCITTW